MRRLRSLQGALAVGIVAGLALPSLAIGHIERASYWPDPRPEKLSKNSRITTGGKVPSIRSLASALSSKPAGSTRVVCQTDSLKRLNKSIRRARANGYYVRPHDHRSLSAKQAARLLAVNRALAKRCKYHEIQPAVTASRNNDRVVIMPGLYTEPTARKAKTHDPSCAKYDQENDRGQSGAVSYAHQWYCPNDQNLIAVMGRRPGRGQDPQPPLDDRHGIPNLGPCVRCNVQIEGSGVSADDVVIDAGNVKSGNHGPIGAKKDVGIRADRTDGFVLRKVLVRHAGEHNIYILEADGYVFDSFKTYYAGEYGVLTFVEDHGIMQNCDAAGHADSALYPGAAGETGEEYAQAPAAWGSYRRFRYNQQIRYCDMHHNAAGYSGTDGNAVHIHHNNFYDNTLGFTTDVATARGHPGFPQDSDLVEHNNFFSNNLNNYAPGADIYPSEPFPIGVGLWIAGGNNNTIRRNRFWDNWRRGVMLFAVPDATVCAPPDHQHGCNAGSFSTSHRNRFYENVMGVAPNGTAKPNGVDFWWDHYVGNRANCWYGNTAAPGRNITTDPSGPEPIGLWDCDGGKNPGESIGMGNAKNEQELGACAVSFETGNYDPSTCPWFAMPSQPGR